MNRNKTMLDNIFWIVFKFDFVTRSLLMQTNQILPWHKAEFEKRMRSASLTKPCIFYQKSQKCQGLDKTAHKVVINCS